MRKLNWTLCAAEMAPVLLLLSLPLALCCQTAPSPECENVPFVPGHNLVGEGFDVVQMKTTGAIVVDVRTYMTGGDRGNCTLCDNTLLNKKQKLPASVVDWRIKVQCRHSLSAKVYESASSVVKETTNSIKVGWKAGLSVPNVGGAAVGGTLSASVKFAQSHSSQDKFSYTSHTFSCSYYTFRLLADPPVTKEFNGSLYSLPLHYNKQSEAAYNHFISIYGTHFLRNVNLGGRVKSTTAVRTCQVAMTGLSVQDVSICLSAEASVVIKGVNASKEASFCAARQKKLENNNSFSGSFSDRVTEVLGGNGENHDILFGPDDKNGYGEWLKSLKMMPGVISYSLTSLHMLVKNDPVRQASLQTAISQYITKSAISLACSSKCKVGRHDRNCACKCSGHQRVDSNCCPSKPGVATLSVVVVSAAGLYGDLFSKTDGYVKVFYGTDVAETPVIWNNNFPRWNFHHSFGTVELTEKKPVLFEVWDRDNRWNDNRLGKGSIVPTQGADVKKQIKLKHGTVQVSITAECGPSLAGSYCDKYAPTPGGDGALTNYNPFKPVTFQKSKGFTDNNLL